jgi:hypothetical protein
MAHRGVDGKKFQARPRNRELVFELVAGSDRRHVGLLVIAVLGFVFSLVLDEIERMLIPWKANA